MKSKRLAARQLITALMTDQCPWRNLIDCANRGFAIFRQHFAHSSYFARLAKCDHYWALKVITGQFLVKFSSVNGVLSFNRLYHPVNPL
jgi:hypothetical protein